MRQKTNKLMRRCSWFMGVCHGKRCNVASRQAEVVGSDSGIYPPMSTVLQQAGIRMYDGFSDSNLRDAQPDLVVVGNAISRGNPEVEWLLESRSFPLISLPQMLAEGILCQRRNLVVSGTHGKTTTTTLSATLLRAGGRDPGWLIGGVPLDLPVVRILGESELLPLRVI